MIVAFVFAARAGMGLLLTDLFLSADPACECELESPTEEIEADDHVIVAMVACLTTTDPLALAPQSRLLSDVLRTPRARLSLRPPLLRGPPA